MYWLLFTLLTALWLIAGLLTGFPLSLAVIPLRKGCKRLQRAFSRVRKAMTPRRRVKPVAGSPGDDWWDEYLDDRDPSEPGDPWSEYLDHPHVIEACIPHLQRCYDLDPTKHS